MRIVQMLALLCVLPGAMASAAMAPEQAVEVDTRYLSPPQVVPQGGQSVAEQVEGVMRLTGRGSAEGNAFTWPLRYAIQVRNYPIIDIYYRAQNVLPHPTTGNSLLQMTMLNAAGQITPAIILETSELIQDGAVHEIRKDLGRFAADNAITEISFTFNTPVTGGTLELAGLRFEQGPTSPAPFMLPRENVDFVVTDANGVAVPDAEVRAGLVERGNWTTVGRTDWQGRVTLQVVRPVRPDGTFVDPVEAMVIKPGYVPQYVAPIEFPRTGAMQVKMTVVPPAVQAPVGEEPDGTYYYVPTRETVVYDSYPSVVYVQAWSYPWWIPPYFCGYRPYYFQDRYYYYHRPGYRYDWDRHRDWDDRRGDWRRDDWDRSAWRRPDYSPVPTPRDIARRDYRRDVLRGNDPGGSLQHSEEWRRANTPPPPAHLSPGPRMPTEDRGDRYRRTDTDAARTPAAPTPAPTPDRGDRYRRTEVTPPRTPAAPVPAPAPTPDRGDRYQRDANEPRRIAPSPVPTPAPTPTPDRERNRRDTDDSRSNARPPAPAPAPAPAPSDRGDRPQRDIGRPADPPAVRNEPRPTPPVAAPTPAPDRDSRGRREDDTRRDDPPAVAPGGDRGDRYRRDRAQVGADAPRSEIAKPKESETPRRADPPVVRVPVPAVPKRVDVPPAPEVRQREVPAPETRREAPAPQPRREAPAPEVRREAPAPQPRREAPAPEVRREAPAPQPRREAPAEVRREMPAPRQADVPRGRSDDRSDAYDARDDGPGRSGGRAGRGR